MEEDPIDSTVMVRVTVSVIDLRLFRGLCGAVEDPCSSHNEGGPAALVLEGPLGRSSVCS